MSAILKINNLEVNLDRLTHPKLTRIVFDRKRQFLFNHSEHTESKNGERSYTEHTDKHTDRYGDYSERSWHTDDTRVEAYDQHIDRTKSHTEYSDSYSDYSDHSEYNDVRMEHNDNPNNYRG